MLSWIGDLGHDDAEAAAGHLFDVRDRPHGQPAFARAVGQLDLFAAQHQSAGREVRPLDEVHQLVDCDLVALGPAVDRVGDGVHDFSEVVRRDVRGHADRDAAAAVEEQVGQQAREHDRLLQAAVEIVGPIDRFLLDIGQQRFGDARQPRLGVTHGCGRVAVDRAKVALPVDQGIAQAEVLRHARHRVVDRGVAVRMILAEHLTDDTGGFLVGAARSHAHIVHGIEDAALHRLQAIAGVGQGARHDHAHGVVEV